tara:strand:+ start:6773 stop:7510 length:738 start_codon:yes stop_codon:yes gene_type:complete
MKIALAFWGLTRSLKFTIKSIEDNIFNVFRENNIDFKIFQHTYYFDSIYNNPRANERNAQLDFEEYKLLKADYLKRDDQDIIKSNINFKQYYSRPDPWNTKYISVNNFILSLYSKKQVTEMIEKCEENFDIVIFLRCDVKYLNKFDINIINNINNNTLYLPNFAAWFNFNDRACVCSYEKALIYGKLFNYMLEYSKKKPLHSEKFHHDILCKQFKINIKFIPFYFNRVRCDGKENINDHKDARKF